VPLQARAILIVLLSALLLAANAIAVSAEVVSNVRVTIGPFMQPNVCEPTEGPLTFTVTEHRLRQVESDGTVVFHVNAHGTAVTANGTRYEINRTLVSTTTAGVTTTEIFIRRISHGSGDNAVITIVNGVVTDQRCLG
jgi:hypothetical protein